MASQHPYISETSAQEQLHSSQQWDRSKLKRVYSLATSKGLVFWAGNYAGWIIGLAVYCVMTKKHTTRRRSFSPEWCFLSFVFPGGQCSMNHPFLPLRYTAVNSQGEFRICPVTLMPKTWSLVPPFWCSFLWWDGLLILSSPPWLQLIIKKLALLFPNILADEQNG